MLVPQVAHVAQVAQVAQVGNIGRQAAQGSNSPRGTTRAAWTCTALFTSQQITPRQASDTRDLISFLEPQGAATLIWNAQDRGRARVRAAQN